MKKNDLVRYKSEVGIVWNPELANGKVWVMFMMKDGTMLGFGEFDKDQLVLERDAEWKLARTYWFRRVNEMKREYG